MKDNKCKIEIEGKIPLINTCVDASVEISHPCKKPPKPEPFAEYKRIEMTLPQPPGLPPLPPSIFFDMDTRLDEASIHEVIASLIFEWGRHYREKEETGKSQWSECALKYAFKNLTPVWLDKERKFMVNEGKKALDFLMDTFTSFLIQNGTWNAPIAKIDYLPPTSSSTIFSENANKQFHVPLDFSVNPIPLQEEAIRTLAGSLFHAWMHRMGYRHPKEEYTSYLIGEAPMCLMRGYADKEPSIPDSAFTRFFD
ncbi:hypothetical protein [Cytobacillus oceanisediminis]|uniref:hypothetical protein n=1 Tax=Cytobacillus oceanisediminis TaxID=665099 RepID=UPI001FB45FFC|nr:hypothetical protein [Cytobacillus oceanisediminis]UOE58016.1 hypothetical protein IRB79_27510 [Cytobacillus oceanisediminis]